MKFDGLHLDNIGGGRGGGDEVQFADIAPTAGVMLFRSRYFGYLHVLPYLTAARGGCCADCCGLVAWFGRIWQWVGLGGWGGEAILFHVFTVPCRRRLPPHDNPTSAYYTSSRVFSTPKIYNFNTDCSPEQYTSMLIHPGQFS